MRVILHPSAMGGVLQAPTSKSSMQRACAGALLAGGETTIINAGRSNDDLAAMGVIEALGARLSALDSKTLQIISHGVDPVSSEVNCGESGLGIRMFTPIIALSAKRMTINGHGSLLSRPMNFFDEVLPKLGVEVASNKGRLPVTIQGPLHPKDIVIDGSLSSQFLTGMLFAYSASATEPAEITVRNLSSRPYIDLTLAVMEAFGLPLPVNTNYTHFYFPGAAAAISQAQRRIYQVEGDWSGAAFLLVAGAIAGELTIEGLMEDSVQADKAILAALRLSGAELSISKNQVRVARPMGTKLTGFEFDATDCPDLFPPLVALAAYAHGVTTIKGATRLTHKESNRAQTLQEEFSKMGIGIALQGDIMKITGNSAPRGSIVHSHNDHRIAMACTVAGLSATGDTIIDEAQVVGKSYPHFYEDLIFAGARLSQQGPVF